MLLVWTWPAFVLASAFQNVLLARLTWSTELYIRTFDELIAESDLKGVCQRAICFYTKDHHLVRELQNEGRLAIIHQELQSYPPAIGSLLLGQVFIIDRDDRIRKYAEIYDSMGIRQLDEVGVFSLVAFPISRQCSERVRSKFEYLIMTMMESGLWEHYETLYGLPRFNTEIVNTLGSDLEVDEADWYPLTMGQLSLPFWCLFGTIAANAILGLVSIFPKIWDFHDDDEEVRDPRAIKIAWSETKENIVTSRNVKGHNSGPPPRAESETYPHYKTNNRKS